MKTENKFRSHNVLLYVLFFFINFLHTQKIGPVQHTCHHVLVPCPAEQLASEGNFHPGLAPVSSD